ncbi:MAG: hypothetical protein JWR16_2537 [Nevskia sp.]|nr:hypothetical protein [Nevskia sp.]
MIEIKSCGSQHWRQVALSLTIAAAVSACTSTPVADSSTAGVSAAPAEVVVDTPTPPDVDAPSANSDALPSNTEIVLPACVPLEPKPKPKPKPKPVPKEAPPQPQTDASVSAIPAGGVIDADVQSLSSSVVSILGKKVQGPQGEDLGRVVDVLADASGRVRVAIIDFGGFLGVGNRRIAVDWPLLRFNPDDQDKSLILSLSREKLQTAPEYKDSTHPQALMVPAAAKPAP